MIVNLERKGADNGPDVNQACLRLSIDYFCLFLLLNYKAHAS